MAPCLACLSFIVLTLCNTTVIIIVLIPTVIIHRVILTLSTYTTTIRATFIGRVENKDSGFHSTHLSSISYLTSLSTYLHQIQLLTPTKCRRRSALITYAHCWLTKLELERPIACFFQMSCTEWHKQKRSTS